MSGGNKEKGGALIMKKVLTVVVPSYNVEKYLEQTLDSFLNDEVMEDVEVLIVDDGSKDGTAGIGRRYEEKYPDTFRLISKENGGHGSTINTGIAQAAGKYFKVVDGDDWVEKEGFCSLVRELKNCSEEYILTNYYEVNDVTGEKTEKKFAELPVGKAMPFDEAARKVQMPMHALVIRTDILRDNRIRLDEHCFYVDVEYILYPVPYVRTVRYLDCFVYMYRLAVATQSVSMQGYQKHLQNHTDVIMHLLDYLGEYEKSEDADEVKYRYMARRIAQMAETQMNIYLSYPLSDTTVRGKFKEFDETLKQKNRLVYHWTGQYSGMLRMLRKTGFKAYTAVVVLSRLRNRKDRG